MSEIFPFFIVLLAGLVFSRVFQKFNVPWTVTLIATGAIIGPFGLRFIVLDSTLEFLKYLGLVFLMFMAGLEMRFSGFREVWRESIFIGIITGLTPFIVGIFTGLFFGYEISAVLLLGIVFISSSIAIIIPALQAKGLFHSRIGKIVIFSIVFQDVASLVFLAVALQYLIPGTLPFPVFVTFFIPVLLIIAVVKWGIPRLRWIFEHQSSNRFERDLRIVFTVLVGTVIIFEFLGLHAIIGAFLAGLVLSEAIQEKRLKEKIHVMAYGLFIPVFFIMVGADINIGLFIGATSAISLTAAIILGAIIAKFLGGWLSGRIIGLTSSQSALVGGACVPRLSTALAIVTVGQRHGLLPEELVTTLIILSITTILISPLILEKTIEKVRSRYFVKSLTK